MGNKLIQQIILHKSLPDALKNMVSKNSQKRPSLKTLRNNNKKQRSLITLSPLRMIKKELDPLLSNSNCLAVYEKSWTHHSLLAKVRIA